MKKLPPRAVFALAFVIATPLAAQEAAPPPTVRHSISFSAGAGVTDNITRAPTDEQSETILSAGTRIDLKQATRRLDTTLTADLNYLDYLENTYDSELVGRLEGDLRVALAPGRLFWDFSDNYGQAQIDPFAPVTPTNREDVNYFSTGPDAEFKMGSAGFAQLAARVSDVAYEISPLDSQRIFAAAGVGRELTSGGRVSLHADWQQVNFDNDVLNTDYDLGSAYVRYELKGARTEFSANGGAITFDGATSDTGPLLQLLLTRQMSSASTLSVGAGREFTDAASAFRERPSLLEGVSSTIPATLTSDVFDRSYANVDWRYQRHRTGMVVSVRYSDDQYENRQELDVARTELYLSLDRQMTPAFSGSVFGSYTDSDYDNAGFEDKVESLGLELSYLIGRHYTLSLNVSHEQRKVDGGGTGYDETRSFLRLSYRVQ